MLLLMQHHPNGVTASDAGKGAGRAQSSSSSSSRSPRQASYIGCKVRHVVLLGSQQLQLTVVVMVASLAAAAAAAAAAGRPTQLPPVLQALAPDKWPYDTDGTPQSTNIFCSGRGLSPPPVSLV